MQKNWDNSDPIEICPVHTRRQRRAFAVFPWRIYKDDPLWVPPLVRDRLKAFDKSRHRFYRHGDAEFCAAHRRGRMVGTVCVAEDRFHNQELGKREAMFGYFDCIDDEEVARALFDHAESCARKRGLERIVGPFNLDYEDRYGVLLDGRDRRPAILCGHSPKYYRGFFERYGFEPARAVNIALGMDFREGTNELRRLAKLAESIQKRGRFTVREADFKRWDEEISTVHRLMNESLKVLPDFIPLSVDDVHEIADGFKEVADPRLILFVDRGDETIGWIAAIPDFNEHLARLNGLRFPWDYLRLPFVLRRRLRAASMKSILMVPEHHRTGAIIPALDQIAKRLIEGGYEWLDFSLTSEDNPQTPYIARKFGAEIYKRYQVYAKDITS